MEIQTNTGTNATDEITVLRAKIQELETHIANYENNKIPFSGYAFQCYWSVEYLRLCNLDYRSLEILFNMCEKLDFSCIKYILDCYDEGKYDWNENYIDERTFSNKQPIHFICTYGSEQAMLYVLNLYMKNNLSLDCTDDNKMQPIHFICSNGSWQTIKYILDIYVEKNFDIECEDKYGMKPINYLCDFGSWTSIKYILDIYTKKNLSFDQDVENNKTVQKILNAKV